MSNVTELRLLVREMAMSLGRQWNPDLVGFKNLEGPQRIFRFERS
jgi:hypothetical protein